MEEIPRWATDRQNPILWAKLWNRSTPVSSWVNTEVPQNIGSDKITPSRIDNWIAEVYMTLIKLCDEYLNGKITAINLIRSMSGMFNPDHAVSILTIVCAITRIEEGDLDKDTFRSVYLKQKVDNEQQDTDDEREDKFRES